MGAEIAAGTMPAVLRDSDAGGADAATAAICTRDSLSV